MRIISIATGTSVKCYSPNLFPSFKPFLELSFCRIMHTHMLQRLFETSLEPNIFNFFLGLYSILGTCGSWLFGVHVHNNYAVRLNR